MLDHMILTVSNVGLSLAFYEAALKPLNIKFFLPYKGEGDHPDLWGFGDGKRAFFKQGKPDPASIHWAPFGGYPQVWLQALAGEGVVTLTATGVRDCSRRAVYRRASRYRIVGQCW